MYVILVTQDFKEAARLAAEAKALAAQAEGAAAEAGRLRGALVDLDAQELEAGDALAGLTAQLTVGG